MTEIPYLTLAMRRALEAVAAGKALHIYTQRGNIYRGPKGTDSRCFRKLEAFGFIADIAVAEMPGTKEIPIGVMLTATGQQVRDAYQQG